MCADWDAITSSCRVGTARSAMARLCPSSLGVCSVFTAVILLLLKVTATWTGPYWVETASPLMVTTFGAPEVVEVDDELDFEPDLDVVLAEDELPVDEVEWTTVGWLLN